MDLITDGQKEVQSLAAANLANMAKSSLGRNILKRHGGIQKLVRVQFWLSLSLSLSRSVTWQREGLVRARRRIWQLERQLCATRWPNGWCVGLRGSNPPLIVLMHVMFLGKSVLLQCLSFPVAAFVTGLIVLGRRLVASLPRSINGGTSKLFEETLQNFEG